MAKKSPAGSSRKRKPRLLWANPFCLLDTSSGASMSVRQMLHQLVANGYEVQVLGATVFDNPKGMGPLKKQYPDLSDYLHQRIEVEDGPLTHQLVVTFSTNRRHVTSHEEGLWHSQYSYLLDTFKPDLVWYYGGQTLDLLIADEARARGIPSAFYLANGNYKAFRWCRDVDLILTDSQATADMYRKSAGFAATPVGKFIDPHSFVAEKHKRQRLLFVNPSWAKGASVVVQLAQRLETLRPDIQLEVVEARADWTTVLRDTTRKMGQERHALSNVIVTPNTSDMRGPYGRARVLLAPSLWWESSGRVLAEAMLNGIPALITNRGGMPEMIKDAGIAFDFPGACYEEPYQHLFSDEELKPLLDAVINFYDDEALYQDFVVRAYRVGEKYHHIDRATERLLSAFSPLIRPRIGSKDFRISLAKRHRQNLSGTTLSPEFKVDTSFFQMIQASRPANGDTFRLSAIEDFSWKLNSKIIVLDNRAKLIKRGLADSLAETGAFGIVAFDPANEVDSHERYEGSENIQVFQHALLGDGQQCTLYTCISPEMTATLQPLPTDQIPIHRRLGAKVITKLPINTIALDSIEGLESLDWLILDELSDALAVLKHGKKKLKDTLLVQARVAFQPTHKRQPSLAELHHWASRNGFRFYCINDTKYYSHIPESIEVIRRPSSEQESADVLFLPSCERMAVLSIEQKMKLSLILASVFDAKDKAYALLNEVDSEVAKQYLRATGIIESRSQHYIKPISNLEDIKRCLNNAPLEPLQNNHGLPGHLVVSLTSYAARFGNLHLTLRSLLLQKTSPDSLILWLAEGDRKSIPEEVSELKAYGLDIRFCEDIRSYKKIIPTIRHYPSSFIVTADDDIFYEPDWLENLIRSWDGSNKTVVAHRAHKIRVDNTGKPLPYKQWKWEVGPEEAVDGRIFPTGCAGVLYPPNVFHPEVTNSEKFMKICPSTDDIWLYWMASMNGAKTKRSNYFFNMVEWPGESGTPLWKGNIQEGGNDNSINNMYKEFGSPWVKLISQRNGDSFSVAGYWDSRYRRGGTSGSGSYGRLARFKASVINTFVKRNRISSVIEFGCGDGNQLSLLELDDYLGVDISPTVIDICRDKFMSDSRKRFLTLDQFESSPQSADLTISLDVIYHLIDDSIYHEYMHRLFSSSTRYCIVYSANNEEFTSSVHVRKRRFTDWVDAYADGWEMIDYIPNRYPMHERSDPNNTSFADFYMYEKK